MVSESLIHSLVLLSDIAEVIDQNFIEDSAIEIVTTPYNKKRKNTSAVSKLGNGQVMCMVNDMKVDVHEIIHSSSLSFFLLLSGCILLALVL